MEMLPKVGDTIQVAGMIFAIREDGSCWMVAMGEAHGPVTAVKPTGFVEFTCSLFGKARVHKTAIVAIQFPLQIEPTWESPDNYVNLL